MRRRKIFRPGEKLSVFEDAIYDHKKIMNQYTVRAGIKKDFYCIIEILMLVLAAIILLCIGLS